MQIISVRNMGDAAQHAVTAAAKGE